MLLPGLRRHPRALPAGARHRRPRHAAARLARPVRAPRGGAAGRRRRTPRGVAARLRHRARRRRHDDARWSSARTSPRPSTRCSRRPTASGCGSPPGSSSRDRILRRATCSPRPSAPTRRRASSPPAGTAQGRLRYAVTPRFSLSCQRRDARVVRARLFAEVPGAWFTSHVNENLAEIAEVAAAVRRRVLRRHLRPARPGRPAHACWPTTSTRPTRSSPLLAGQRRARSRTARRATRRSAAACSRCAATSTHGVRVALGSDVGAGTGFSLLKEGLQAYFMQQLLGAEGVPLTSAHLLHLATARRRRRARARRRGRRPVGGQAVRRDLGAAPGRRPARTSGCGNAALRRGRARQGLRARHDHRRRRGSGSAATRSPPDRRRRPATAARPPHQPARADASSGPSVQSNQRGRGAGPRSGPLGLEHLRRTPAA